MNVLVRIKIGPFKDEVEWVRFCGSIVELFSHSQKIMFVLTFDSLLKYFFFFFFTGASSLPYLSKKSKDDNKIDLLLLNKERKHFYF